MKNISMFESLSIDSTLESPFKPDPLNGGKKLKDIFLIHSQKDAPSRGDFSKESTNEGEKVNEEKNKKPKKRGRKPIKNKKIEFVSACLLDFDSLIKNLIKEKEEKTQKIITNASKTEKIKKMKPKKKKNKKLLGNKRKRPIKETINKNKNKLYNKDNKIISRLDDRKININKKSIKKKKENTPSSNKKNNCNNNKSRYDIYEINNFCSNTVKIRERTLSHNVLCPTFQELNDDFFEDNNIEVSFIII